MRSTTLILALSLSAWSTAALAVPPKSFLTVPPIDGDGNYSISWSSSSGATRYEVRRMNPGTSSWTEIYDGPNLSKTESNTSTSGVYGYVVRACNGTGCSGFSVRRDVTVTLTPPPKSFVSVPAEDADGHYTINWTSSAGASRYQVLRMNPGTSTWTTIYNNSGLSKSEANTSNPGSYGYVVQACDGALCSGYSARQDVNVTLTPPPKSYVSVPADDQDGHYTISWTPSSGASSYEVRRMNPRSSSWVTIYNGPNLSKAEINPGPGLYGYVVRACNGTLCSGFSARQDVVVTGPYECAENTHLSPQGLVALFLNKPANHPFQDVLSLCHVDGGKVRVHWSALEPAPGNYNWSLIDNALDATIAEQKFLSISIAVAAFTPQWVMDSAETFTYIHPHPAVGQVTAPVPWDPYYLAQLDNMIAALGARYDGNPYIYFVEVNGPASFYGIETNFPSTSITDNVEALSPPSLFYNEFEAGWMHGIDTYVAAFPNTRLAITLHHDFGYFNDDDKRYTTPINIREYALSRVTSEPIIVRLNGLSKNGGLFPYPYTGDPSSVPRYVDLAFVARASTELGYEAVSRYACNGYNVRDVVEAIDNGASYYANTLEFFDDSELYGNICGGPSGVFTKYLPAMRYGHAQLAQ